VKICLKFANGPGNGTMRESVRAEEVQHGD